MKAKEFKPDYNLRALVHVMVPKFGTLQWAYMPNARFVMLLEAAYEDSSVDTRRKLDRGTDEFIECWRTVAEVREYVHRFDMLAFPSHFLLNEILHSRCPKKIDEKIMAELMKYPREPDELLYSIARGINSGCGKLWSREAMEARGGRLWRPDMCNSSAASIDAEIMDELRRGKKVDSNGKYDGIVQAIVNTAKEIRVGANHIESVWLNGTSKETR